VNPVSIVIPNWNGRRWLPGCLEALAAQEIAPAQVIVVDNGSKDGSLQYLASEHPKVHVISLERNTGFARAANCGIEAAAHDYIALVNTDVELAPGWTARMAAALAADPGLGSVACKMVDLECPAIIYDAGDVLRRDGQCLQRGRFQKDAGAFDEPSEIFGACAGAAIYRGSAVQEVGGFDERLFAYLEDVDLALRLGLAGWRCRYEPVVARHAGGGSSGQLTHGLAHYVQRNTLLLVVKAFPLRWLPLVLYRQLALIRLAARQRRLREHLQATAAVLPLLPAALRERRRLRRAARVPVEAIVAPQSVRGRNAEGHPSRHAGAAQPAVRPGSL
jgi:GT2 family glycosyltransferase